MYTIHWSCINFELYRQTLGTIAAGLWCFTLSADERISKIKKHKRELQVRVIESKVEIADIVHQKCVFLLNNIFDDRKKQCCVMYDCTSWLVWNFNMEHQSYLLYTMSHNSICIYLNWFITNCNMDSLHNEHSHHYQSFQKRRHYTSLISSQFLQIYIVLISQRKKGRLFLLCECLLYERSGIPCSHILSSRSQMKLKSQWSKYSTGNISSLIWWWKYNAEPRIDEINLHSIKQWEHGCVHI